MNPLDRLTAEQLDRFQVMTAFLDRSYTELSPMDLVQFAHWVHTGRNLHMEGEAVSDDAASWTADVSEHDPPVMS